MTHHDPARVRLFYEDSTLHCFACHRMLTAEEAADIFERVGITRSQMRDGDRAVQSWPWYRQAMYALREWWGIVRAKKCWDDPA